MYLCTPHDNSSYIYFFVDKYDTTPYAFTGAYGYPVFKDIKTVEIEDEENADDDGNSYTEEVEVYFIPTNCYKSILFKHKREQERFTKVVEKYYSKEKK